MPKRDISGFIAHWSAASPSERANSQAFLLEFCELLEVPQPDNHPANGYFFEYPVVEQHPDGTTSNGRVDLYQRNRFVLESKQFQEAKAEASQLQLAAEEAVVIEKKKSSQPVRGTEAWDEAMIKARGQAERYVRAIPNDNPPFIIVVDVGHSFEIYSDFTQAGKAYLPFPDPRTFRVRLADLADEKIRARLRLIWTDPAALDPAKQSADVTREVSGHLAELAKSLEEAGHEPDTVAQFLTRCLFCMFAEDVELLPKNSFTELLESIAPDGSGFQEVMQTLFKEMNTGTKGVSVILRKKLLKFNGGLFANDTVLPINGLQLGLLKNASRQNWRNVEPAIFGTLLERALNPDERHQLGAHYTPRAYVERLVLPTVIEPLRAEWENVRAAAITQARAGDLKRARAEVNGFHERLCGVTVLDPACGSGNFLYVALQHLKVLEGEVLDVAAQFGENFKLELETHTVDPHQFLGLEINPRAASIAELVLWTGYLQWHFKLHGKTTPPEPILRAFKNIQCRDAVPDYDGEPQSVLDPAGKPITVWDRRSKKTDMVTGRDVPDESKRVPLLTYANPRPAQWPAADFIVGNPPFIGKGKLREDLGDGYAETLRATYPDVPESADFVLYWWHKAAEFTRTGKARRFGLITTNSLRQTFARRVVQMHLSPVAAVCDRRYKPTPLARLCHSRSSVGGHDGRCGGADCDDCRHGRRTHGRTVGSQRRTTASRRETAPAVTSSPGRCGRARSQTASNKEFAQENKTFHHGNNATSVAQNKQHMKIKSLRLVAVGLLALVALVIGCSTTKQTENLLSAAGFKMVPATTPQQQAHLKTLPPDKVTRVVREGKTYFAFPNAKQQVLYVGQQAQYDAYQKLRKQQQLAEAQLAETDAAAWSHWGEFDF